MFAKIKQLFSSSNKDLRHRIYFTLVCLAIFAYGTTITIPWADTIYQELGFLEIFNLMAGGGLKTFSIFMSDLTFKSTDGFLPVMQLPLIVDTSFFAV